MNHVIYKGWHYSLPPLPIFVSNREEYKYEVEFDNSAQYDIGAEQEDINKLCGISFGFFGIHKNSARFGWRWNTSTNNIEILAYCYDAGVRLAPIHICYLEPGKPIQLSIKISEKAYTFTASSDNVTQPKTHNGKGIVFACRPYFGGNMKSPHKINIHIQ